MSHQSQKQAVIIVASLYAWLQAAQYLSVNPWALVNQKTGDDRALKLLDTKAMSEDASAAILAFIEAQPATPSRAHRLHRALCPGSGPALGRTARRSPSYRTT